MISGTCTNQAGSRFFVGVVGVVWCYSMTVSAGSRPGQHCNAFTWAISHPPTHPHDRLVDLHALANDKAGTPKNDLSVL